MVIESEKALQRLREGNRRFVELAPEARTRWDRESATEARPFCAVLCCSDARAPAEFVFDVGLGDLFVIRVAGNIVAPSQVGSNEFAVERFGTSLVVVLGHSNCGAILATLEQLLRPTEQQSPHLRSIVDRVRPSVAPLLGTEF